MSKPITFNYQDHVDALKRIRELEDKVEKQSWEIMKLKEENTNMKIHVRILTEDLKAERGKNEAADDR